MSVLSLTREELIARVSGEAAANVLFVMHGEGFKPGSFTTALIHALAKADTYNLMKLGREYPDLAAAVDAYKNADHGLSTLQEIMENFIKGS